MTREVVMQFDRLNGALPAASFLLKFVEKYFFPAVFGGRAYYEFRTAHSQLKIRRVNVPRHKKEMED